MTWIIKRIKGNREEFEAEKIRRSIKKAYIDSGESVEEHAGEIERIAREVIEWASREEGSIETKEIRDRIIEKLEKVRPTAADAWKKFEEKYKKRQ